MYFLGEEGNPGECPDAEGSRFMQLYDFVASGILYVISGVMLWQICQLEYTESKILPIIVTIGLIICATLMIVRRLRKKDTEDVYDFSGSERAAILGLITLSYAFLAELFGFYPCTLVYIFVTMFFLGQKNKKVMILVPILTTICVYLMFQVFFSVSLPRGSVIDILSYFNL